MPLLPSPFSFHFFYICLLAQFPSFSFQLIFPFPHPLYSDEPFSSFKSKDLRFSPDNSSGCTSSLNLSVRTNQPAKLPVPCWSALVIRALVSQRAEANHAIATMFGQPTSSVYCISSSINVTHSPKAAWPSTDHTRAPNSLKFFQIERSQEPPVLFPQCFQSL